MSHARFAVLAAAEGDAASAEERSREAERGMTAVGGSLAPWIASRLRDIPAWMAIAR